MIKVIDKPEEPPRIAVKFANTVFVLGCLLSILIAIYAIYRGYTLSITNSFYLICILFSGISATLFYLGLRLKNNHIITTITPTKNPHLSPRYFPLNPVSLSW